MKSPRSQPIKLLEPTRVRARPLVLLSRKVERGKFVRELGAGLSDGSFGMVEETSAVLDHAARPAAEEDRRLAELRAAAVREEFARPVRRRG
jgi:hypothetical protein